jgi:hypothetical protein
VGVVAVAPASVLAVAVVVEEVAEVVVAAEVAEVVSDPAQLNRPDLRKAQHQ